MNQRTLKNIYSFEGKGLHSGKYAHMRVCPAPVNTGLRFHRVDLGPDAYVDAVAENVSLTSRSTTIEKDKVSVSTIEHLLSALTGLGVDNALIEIDNVEVPILDGSAEKYVEVMAPDGVQEQDAEKALNDDISKLQKGDVTSVVYSAYDEQFQAVGILAIVFLVIEVCLLEIKNPLLRNVKFFKKEAGKTA